MENNSHIAAVTIARNNRSVREQTVRAAFKIAVDPAIEAMLGGRPDVNLSQAFQAGAKAFDLESAIQATNLPADVLTVLDEAGLNKKKQPKELAPVEEPLVPVPKEEATVSLDPAAVEKAVVTLNDMVFQAQIRLDKKAIECQEFKEQNQVTLTQVRDDLSRLGGTITNLGGTKLATTSSNAEADKNTQSVIEEQEAESKAHNLVMTADQEQLAIHKADLEVTDYMLELSKCKDADYTAAAGAFVQHTAAALVTAAGLSTQLEACVDTDGNVSIAFDDQRFETTRDRLTGQGKQLLDFALRKAAFMAGGKAQAEALKIAGMAYGDGLEDLDDGDDDDQVARKKVLALFKQSADPVANAAMRAMPDAAVAPAEPAVAGPVDAEKQGKRCGRATPDCGVLHDTMANLWGEMKDFVERLQDKMREDEAAFTDMNNGFNAQIASLTTQKGELAATLAETLSMTTSETDAQTKKNKEKIALETVFDKTTAECQATMRDILFTEICGTITIRNEVLSVTKLAKHDDIVDCDFGGWITQECSMPCDDNLVGGIQFMEREVSVAPSKYGAACPALNMTKKCNQIRCPVDCVLSDYEEYSKCTQVCGGGVKSRTRTMEVQQKNGGKQCDQLTQTIPCNSGSCDRDCTLTEWSPFTPCTQACDGGTHDQVKDIIVPKRADGVCATEDAPTRFFEKSCNTQPCVGDEVCVAKIDLVIALDGSGSITETGFDILKEFAVKLLGRLQPSAYGTDAVRVAIVQFGNGHLSPEKLVSDAHLIQELDYDLEKTKQAIVGLKWQRGFTNMAQGVLRASNMLKTSLRKDAQGIALMITDGKPSFQFQTEHAVAKLKETATLMVAQVKSFPTEKDEVLMKKYVSAPSSVNYLMIPGKKALKKAYDKYAANMLVHLCSDAESPSKVTELNSMRGFALKARGTVCADDPTVSSSQPTVEACFANANTTQWETFGYAPRSVAAEAGSCLIFGGACKEFKEDLDYNTYELA